MNLYNNIEKFGDYFNSIRSHEGLILVDMVLPLNWEVTKVLGSRGNKIQIQKGKKSDKQKIISFFSPFDEENTEILVDEVLNVVKWNKDLEYKNELLNIKMLELKKMFNENNVDSLKRLNFNFNDILDLNGQEDQDKPSVVQ
jgi:hypothetical protein|tara:strand:- start:2936 stop:3361 length:426 start_codon:yes stop_codon:yes gene_type:complete